MSIYIGNDLSGNKLLHLASGQKSLLDMKSASVDTVFYSTLKYLTFVSYTGTLSAANNGYKWLTVSAADRVSIGNKAIIIVDPNGTMVNGKLKYVNIVYPNLLIKEYSGVWYDATRMLLVPDATTVLGACSVYAVNIENGVYTPPVVGANEITINSSDILVNGVSLTDFNYIHSEPVNSVDKTARYLSKTFQMVNSNTSGSMALIANASYSSINRGGNPIFSTLTGKSIRHLFSDTIALPGDNSFTIPYTFPIAVSTNAFIALVGNYSTTKANTTLLIPMGLTNINYREVYYNFPDFGALLWYNDYISSNSSGITLTRGITSSTGGVRAGADIVHISVFG